MILTSTVTVLLVEDNLAEARFLQEILKGAKLKQFNLVHVKRLADAVERLVEGIFDAILLDLTLPDSQGLASLTRLLQVVPHIPIVVLTNTNDDQLAIEAVRRGAQDYLVKRQVTLESLSRSLCYAIERKQALEELQEVNESLAIQVQQRTTELAKAHENHQFTSEFISLLSHDFRNPLNTILLSAGLLEGNRDKLTKEQQISYFQLIRSAIKDMDRLLSEVLLLGQADAGKLQCDPAPFALEPFCRQLVERLQLEIGKQHQLILTSQGEFKEGLWDSNLMRHILNNLLSNAIKYSPQGGTVQLTLSQQENAVVFRIQDWGIGIPPGEQPQLFQAFYRATNVDAIPGTGLGLALVKRCVEAHGGEIAVESEEGVGTTFTVILPLLREAESSVVM